LIDIWFLHSRSAWGDLLPAVFAIVSFVAHRETLQSLGFTTRGLLAMLSGYAVLLLTACFLSDDPLHLLLRGCIYFAWCVLQQLLFQNLVYRRIRQSLGAGWGAAVLAGTLFASAHLPNPVLVPATLIWGTISARIFERFPNLVAIALLQTLLSSLLLWLTPLTWNHQFHIGPGYWRPR
jgi:membrane protease YdiL (CAAX protease family)